MGKKMTVCQRRATAKSYNKSYYSQDNIRLYLEMSIKINSRIGVPSCLSW